MHPDPEVDIVMRAACPAGGHRIEHLVLPGIRHLSSVALREEQERTLGARRAHYGVLSRALFIAMDLFYGRRKTFSKFKVLELVARVPYQAWEHVSYIAITHTARDPGFARRIFERVRETRQQQDNEQWHLFILQELTSRRGAREDFLRFWLVPQILAFVYYHIVWAMFVVHPAWAYQLNTEFEDHAEHEYMEFVREQPELESEPFESDFRQEYGEFASLADVFRQIGYEERVHKEESLAHLAQPRFA